MSGHVYGVLFDNGLFKVGKTTNPLGRIKKHIGAGKSFGYRLEIFFLSEPHDEYSQTESLLISECSKKFKSNSPEYFCGVGVEAARDIMVKSGLLMAWGNKISASSGSIMITPVSIRAIKSHVDQNLFNRINDLISRNPRGISEGVIKNRFRTTDISDALNEVEHSGSARVEIKIHPCQKTKARVFYPF